MKIDALADDEVCYRALDRNLYAVDFERYPDGMPRAQAPESFIDTLLLRPKSLNTFMQALFWVDALVERGAPVPKLVLPFLPGARQDRLNPPGVGDFLFTVKSIAKELNARRFPSVTLLDPHSDVGPALIDRCRVMYPQLPSGSAGNPYLGVIAPDGGAEKRALRVAQRLGVPLYHAWKTRNIADGRIAGFGVESLPAEGRVLVVDDICDGGGTFIGLAKVLPPALTPELFVTHGLFSQGTDALLEDYAELYCTDSIVGLPETVTVLPVCDDLLQPAH